MTPGFQGEAAAPVAEVEQTDFSELSGSLRFDGGKVRNDDLSMKSPALRIAGEGGADLVKQEVDYLLTTTIVGTSKGQAGAELAELKGVPIPIRVSGPFASLKFRPDLTAAMKARAQGEAQRVIEQEMEKRLGDKVPQELRDTLKDKLKLPFGR
jgi:AsmA protein